MHNIRYLTYEEKLDKRKVLADIEDIAREDGDGYSSRLTWHEGIEPLESYEKAKEFIQKKDNGWYDDHAVRFYDYSGAAKTKKMEEYEAKIKELNKAKMEYKAKHSVHEFKAMYIGCQNCGSRLNKEFIVGESCPLCRSDLRSKTTVDKLKWYDDKIKDCHDRIEVERTKQKKNRKVKWLVKIEYHS